MPHIFKRADGRYSAAVPVGKGKQKHFYGRTRQEVKDKVRAWEIDQEYHVNAQRGAITLAQLLDEWMDNYVKKKNKIRVQEERQRNIKNHIKPVLGHLAIKDIAPSDIQPFINDLEETLEYNTVRNIRSDLRSALNYALRQRYIKYNAASLVTLRKHEQEPAPVWTVDNVLKFEAAIANHRWLLLFQLAIRTGLRQSEILGLQISDLDFDAQTINIGGALQWIAGKLTRTTTKNRNSMAVLVMPPTLVAPLQTLVAHVSTKYPANPYLFVTDNGTPISRYNLWREFKRILAENNLPDIPFHSLRHTCASLLLQEGENVKMVQQQLRHKHITTTLQIYAHIIPDDQRRASTNLDQLLSNPLSKDKGKA